MRIVNFNRKKLYILTIAAIVIYAALVKQGAISSDLIVFMRKNWDEMIHFYQDSPGKFVLIYSLAYILCTAVTLPVAVPLTMVGGAIFGFWKATLLVSFAATLGAAGSFLLARVMLRNWIEVRFEAEMRRLNQQFKLEGDYYLFALRLAPVFPFFLINLFFGLSQMRLRNFIVISYFGMLPGTMLYVNVASQLSYLGNPHDLVSPRVFLSLLAIGLVPIILKRLFGFQKNT